VIEHPEVQLPMVLNTVAPTTTDLDLWKIHVNGSSNELGSGAAL